MSCWQVENIYTSMPASVEFQRLRSAGWDAAFAGGNKKWCEQHCKMINIISLNLHSVYNVWIKINTIPGQFPLKMKTNEKVIHMNWGKRTNPKSEECSRQFKQQFSFFSIAKIERQLKISLLSNALHACSFIYQIQTCSDKENMSITTIKWSGNVEVSSDDKAAKIAIM